ALNDWGLPTECTRAFRKLIPREIVGPNENHCRFERAAFITRTSRIQSTFQLYESAHSQHHVAVISLYFQRWSRNPGAEVTNDRPKLKEVRPSLRRSFSEHIRRCKCAVITAETGPCGVGQRKLALSLVSGAGRSQTGWMNR